MQFQAWFSFISPATFSFGGSVPQAAGTASASPHPLIQDRPTDKFLSPVSSLFYHNILMLRISPNKNSRALLCPQKKHALQFFRQTGMENVLSVAAVRVFPQVTERPGGLQTAGYLKISCLPSVVKL